MKINNQPILKKSFYRKGDKYKVNIEGEVRYFRNDDDLIDYLNLSIPFKKYSLELRTELESLKKQKTILLRDDCVIKRIA